MLIVPIFAIMGCEGISYYSDPVKESEIAGVYYANFGDRESDYIELKSDGSYVHFFVDSEGNTRQDTGRYEFIVRRERSYRIRFPAFIRRHHQIGGCYSNRQGSVVDTSVVRIKVPFYRIGNRYAIEYCPLEGQEYSRKRVEPSSD